MDRLRRARLYLIASVPAAEPSAASLATIEAAVRGGVEVVQLRLKDGDTDLRRRWLRDLAGRIGPSLLLVNDDVEALFSAEGTPLADGLHVGREDAAGQGGLAALRARIGDDLLLGTSTRSHLEIEAARTAGADHVGFGAMAPTTTKAGTSPATSAELRRCVLGFPDLPIFPIGGLGPANLTLVTHAACHRAAIGSAILLAGDPPGKPESVREAAAACRALLDLGAN